ncbi:LysM peptidoglycan-binding domain-containing protein [Pandoraea communis]|uniref:LysM peptidoglycan-binding domain-containing protein n=1 Tax=Pandoraea communis TaxID=2508297 RepID=UPI001FEB68EF|nr:LysM peptidoglycan-binding domain-containing protein [Pandoraea communis]
MDTRFYDGANRVVQTGPAGALPQEYVTALNGAAGGNGSETRQSTYDQNGRLLHQKVTKSDGAAKYEVNYSQYDGAGNVVSYSMANQDGDGYTNNYTYTMARFDGYKEARVDGTSDKFDPGSTTSDYDVNGNLTSVTDSTKPENNRTFVNDAQGHVLYVNQGGHTQRQLVVDGEVLGRYGDMINPDAPQDPNTGNPSFTNKADFSFGFQPINGKYPTGAPGAIAVQAGDMLESIAHSAYGDSKLWYLIAEANGLSGNSDLRVGQSLTIPNRVSTIHNDSKTFKPYDPSQVIGDTTPNLPLPQADSGGGCGGLGTVIMIAVTVIVAVYTAGAAAYAMGAVQAAEGATAASLSFGSAMSAGASAMLGGTAVGGLTVTGATIGGLSAAVGAASIGGIAGSLAGQLAGVTMGAQNGISFNQLALSGLSAAIGAGVGSQIAGASIGASALRAAATNVALQGIGVVTGLQHSFNWTSVAASAAGGAVGGALNAGGASSISQSINNEIGGVLGRTVTGVLVGTAAGLTTSILRGGRVAMQQVATDAFGNALAQGLADKDWYSTESMTERATTGLNATLSYPTGGAGLFGPRGNTAGIVGDPSVDASQMFNSASADDGATTGMRDGAFSFDAISSGVPKYGVSATLAQTGYTDVGRGEVGGWNSNDAPPLTVEINGTNADIPESAGRTHSAPYIGEDANGQGVWGSFPPTNVGSSRSLDPEAFQTFNDRRVIEGTYNKFSEIARAISEQQYGEAWRHLNYEASPAARSVVMERVFPTPSPLEARLNKIQGSPVGSGMSVIARSLGASQHTQDALLDAGGAVEGIAGGANGRCE